MELLVFVVVTALVAATWLVYRAAVVTREVRR